MSNASPEMPLIFQSMSSLKKYTMSLCGPAPLLLFFMYLCHVGKSELLQVSAFAFVFANQSRFENIFSLLCEVIYQRISRLETDF